MKVKGPLYHVTSANRVIKIGREGLVPGRPTSHDMWIGAGELKKHRAGRVFLTSAAGLFFWFNRARNRANETFSVNRQICRSAIFDNLPVVLRVKRPPAALEVDKLGTEDAEAPAYLCACEIPAEEIEVWAGSKWVGTSECARVDCTYMFKMSFTEQGSIMRPEEGNKMFPPGVSV